MTTTTTTRTLFNSAKTAAPRDFGKGLFRSLPAYQTDRTAADEAAAAQMFADAEVFDAMIERLAEESAALDRMERGLDC